MKPLVVLKDGRLIGRLEEVETGFLYLPQWDGKSGAIPIIWKATWEEIIEVVEGELVPLEEIEQ